MMTLRLFKCQVIMKSTVMRNEGSKLEVCTLASEELCLCMAGMLAPRISPPDDLTRNSSQISLVPPAPVLGTRRLSGTCPPLALLGLLLVTCFMETELSPSRSLPGRNCGVTNPSMRQGSEILPCLASSGLLPINCSPELLFIRPRSCMVGCLSKHCAQVCQTSAHSRKRQMQQ